MLEKLYDLIDNYWSAVLVFITPLEVLFCKPHQWHFMFIVTILWMIYNIEQNTKK